MYEVAMAFSVICYLAVVLYFVRSEAFSLFHPLTFYAAFHGFIFVFRPIVAWNLEYRQIYRTFDFVPTPADKLTVILASNLGFLCFSAACLYFGSAAMRFKEDRITQTERIKLTPPFLLIAAICSPIGIYSLISVWSSAAAIGQGYEGMIRDAGTGIAINTTSNGYLMEAQLMLASCSAILAWLFRFRLLALAPILGFVVYRAGTGGRGPFITALVSVGLLYLYQQRRRIPSLRVSMLLLVAIAAFTLVGVDRGASIRRAIGNETSSEVFGEIKQDDQFLSGMDFGNLEYFEYLVFAMPERTGTYGYFVDNLQIFTEPIPRVLWSGKPVGPPFNKIHLMDFGSPIGMTRSLPGQGWYSLGWPGVVIWCSLWGWGLGLLYRRYVEGPQNTIQTAAYMIFLPILIVAFRDGQLITIFRQGLFFIGPIAVWYLVSRYLGIPSAATVRALIEQRRRRSATLEPAVLRPLAMQDPAAERLPLAVARRRLSLSQLASQAAKS